MDGQIETDPAQEPRVIFRGKKRKAYRQRTDNDEQNPTAPASDATTQPRASSSTPDTKISPSENTAAEATAVASEVASSTDDGDLSVAEILRRRNVQKNKVRGVRFGADHGHHAGTSGSGTATGGNKEDVDDLTLMIREEEKHAHDLSSATASAGRRFAPQTGMVGELVNKHMEEYIEAELARKRLAATGSLDPYDAAQSNSTQSSALHTTGGLRDGQGKHFAVQGRLVEVDLGEEMRSRNAELTDRAQRILRGEAIETDPTAVHTQSGPPGKERLGPDGKPWRSKNRRGSDDVKRDQLVEDFLRENKFSDVYETPGSGSNANGGGDDRAGDRGTDDKIAAEFRREFMDAMRQRRRRRRNMADSARQQRANRPYKDESEILRGPKLGGSRNSRAAMREALLQQQNEQRRR